VHGLVVLTGDK